MTQAAAFRGQPLLVLCTLLLGWVAVRAVLWQTPFETLDTALVHYQPVDGTIGGATTVPPEPMERLSAADSSGGRRDGRAPGREVSPEADRLGDLEIGSMRGIFARAWQRGQAEPSIDSGAWRHPLHRPDPAEPGSGHLTERTAPLVAPLIAPLPRQSNHDLSRWSADAWVLLREDTAGPVLAGRPSYGRSQLGGVIRYRLARSSTVQPQAHLRASAALAGARDQEIAAGLSARPVPGLPVRVAVEARVGNAASGTRVRPAAYIVSEFPALHLPLGIRAEVYAQGGYVGGHYATAFVDGQARVERAVALRGGTELSAGAGVWGGAQEDAARLDVGPTMAMSFRLGQARGRLAADYRFRVAGTATPSSGPALTLSAGF